MLRVKKTTIRSDLLKNLRHDKLVGLFWGDAVRGRLLKNPLKKRELLRYYPSAVKVYRQEFRYCWYKKHRLMWI